MTTDTFQKGAVRTARIGDAEVTIAGIAKGSGMIAPDMATMLVFMFTDAAIPAPVLQTLLGRTANRSFNCITVEDRKSTRLNSSHSCEYRMPSAAGKKKNN